MTHLILPRFSFLPLVSYSNLFNLSSHVISTSSPSSSSSSSRIKPFMADKEQESSPNEAIFFVLTYLPLFELFTMARVCRSLRDAVKNDKLPWLKIVVDRPLNRRLSDDSLMEVASMAEGRLQALVLINCITVTDDGLFRIIQHNPLITKLHVPGCTSLSIGGIVRAVQLLTKRLKSLEINGVYGIQKEDVETLRSLIIEPNTKQSQRNKILYHEHGKSSTMKEKETDDPSIDVDVCPKCNEVRMVFDCPRLHQKNKECCRGCSSCIERCIECGVCMKDVQETEDSSCEDALCLECWPLLPKCNFCNKPYCSLHAYQKHTLSENEGFICDSCYSRFLIENAEAQIMNH